MLTPALMMLYNDAVASLAPARAAREKEIAEAVANHYKACAAKFDKLVNVLELGTTDDLRALLRTDDGEMFSPTNAQADFLDAIREIAFPARDTVYSPVTPDLVVSEAPPPVVVMPFDEPGADIKDMGLGYVDAGTAGARADSSGGVNRYWLNEVEVSKAEYERRTDPRTLLDPVPDLEPHTLDAPAIERAPAITPPEPSRKKSKR